MIRKYFNYTPLLVLLLDKAGAWCSAAYLTSNPSRRHVHATLLSLLHLHLSFSDANIGMESVILGLSDALRLPHTSRQHR
ncbi:hypothetical protein F4815DRAFT_467610 [Daldinia loculata]|nr:hypothetical protein F4815DRAFT_467610 [Daldinia loculata]